LLITTVGVSLIACVTPLVVAGRAKAAAINAPPEAVKVALTNESMICQH
jgi:hypothetical protein